MVEDRKDSLRCDAFIEGLCIGLQRLWINHPEVIDASMDIEDYPELMALKPSGKRTKKDYWWSTSPTRKTRISKLQGIIKEMRKELNLKS